MGDQLGEIVGPLCHECAETTHRIGALDRRGVPPRAGVERRTGGGDGAVHVGHRARRALAMTSSVAGFSTSRRSEVAGSTHSPPMNSRSKLGIVVMEKY